MSNHLYGFKNKETGLFATSYRTIRYKVKTACFRTVGNAEKALRMQDYKDLFTVEPMCKAEER